MIGTSRAARLRRFVGAAGLALLVAGGPMAGPAAAAELDQFSGMGTGYALRVTLDVRELIDAVPALQGALDTVWANVPGQSGAFPGVIDQTFIKTTSEADGTTTKARSVLAEGLLDLDAVEATSVGQTVENKPPTFELPSADMPVLSGAAGTLKAAVSSGPNVTGSGKLADLGVAIPLDDLPGDVVTDIVAALTAAITDITDDLTTQLDGLLGGTALSTALVDQLTGQIEEIADETPVGSGVLDDLTGGLGLADPSDLTDTAAVTTALESALDPAALVAQITDLLNTSLLDGALAQLEGLVNITKAAQSGDGVAVANSVAQLKSLDVLGGLVDVGVLNLESHSEAAGTKGSASNDSSCSIADVKVGGDALAISLDGSNVWVNGAAVPVGDVTAQLKTVVDQILETVGIEVGLCETAQVEAEADGTAAAQRVSALRVEVAPLGLFNLVIDPTVETSVAAQIAVAEEDEPVLPRTGAASAATALAGLGLAVGAFALRKRLV